MEYRFILSQDVSTFALVSVIFLSMLVLFLSYINYRKLDSLKHRFLLIGIKLIILTFIFLSLVEPVVLKEKVHIEKNHIILMLDNSLSMNMTSGDSKNTRFENVKDFLAGIKSFLDDMKKESHVDAYLFSDDIKIVDTQNLASQKPSGRSTHLLESIDKIRSSSSSENIGGMIILSDGIDNGTLSANVNPDGTASPEISKSVSKYGFPIYTFMTESKKNNRDLSIEKVIYSSFVFYKNVTSIEVRVKAFKIGAEGFNISLHDESEVLSTQNIKTIEGIETYTAVLRFLPVHTGRRVLTVRIEPVKDEWTMKNNEEKFVVNFIRDRIRILHLCGHPSWDERFLREFLKTNPMVDLVSFFILVNIEDVTHLNEDDTALIPFPIEELFMEELGGFDLVIFQDFNFETYYTERYIDKLYEFFESGGAVLAIGGSKSFTPDNYGMERLGRVLPVIGEFQEITEDYKSLFRAELTSEGSVHPILQLDPDHQISISAWNMMPQLEGLNPTKVHMHDAKILLRHPSLKMKNDFLPVLVVSEQKKGRSAAILTDSSWHWHFLKDQEVPVEHPYQKFFMNLILWLIRDPALSPVKLKLDREKILSGEKVLITVQTPERFHAKLILKAELTNESDKKEISISEWDSESLTGENESSFKTFNFVPEIGGVYKIKLTYDSSAVTGTVEDILLVNDDETEYRQSIPSAPYLEFLSKLTGGKSYSINEKAYNFQFKPPQINRLGTISSYEIMNLPVIFLVVLILLSIEWYLRRRFGHF